MRVFRRLRALVTGSRIANVLQVAALVIGVLVIYHFLGLWWALVAAAVSFVIVSFAIDGGSR